MATLITGQTWRPLRVCKVALACLGAAIGVLILLLVAEHGRVESPFAHSSLPFYGRADLRPRWDSISKWHSVSRFQMQEQSGASFDQQRLQRGPTVVSFFFTACVTVCPVSVDLLLRAHDSLQVGKRRDGLQFLSISVMPLNDDPPALRAYAKQFKLPSDWILATGAPQELSRIAREDFFSDIDTRGADGLPPHLNRAFLLDHKLRIRGVYDASSAHEIVRLRHDVERLQNVE